MRSAVLPASTLKRRKHWKIICSVGFIRKQNKFTQTNTLRHSYYTNTNTQKILWNFEQNDARKTKNIFKTRDKSTTTSKSRVVESYTLISGPTTIHPVFGAELWKEKKTSKEDFGCESEGFSTDFSTIGGFCAKLDGISAFGAPRLAGSVYWIVIIKRFINYLLHIYTI